MTHKYLHHEAVLTIVLKCNLNGKLKILRPRLSFTDIPTEILLGFPLSYAALYIFQKSAPKGPLILWCIFGEVQEAAEDTGDSGKLSCPLSQMELLSLMEDILGLQPKLCGSHMCYVGLYEMMQLPLQ